MLYGDEANAGPSTRGLNRFAAQQQRGEFGPLAQEDRSVPGGARFAKSDTRITLRDEEHLSVWMAMFGQVLGFAGFFEAKRLCDGDW